ncbi:MAG TPA: hypothetical protein HPP51_05505 [Planctomycetes bacterium]|nr:hypothetical protein [Planctomycetota bacterium]
MANTAIEIPFFVASDGAPLTGASAEMDFETLALLDGTDKSASAPAISEIGGGWYKFSVAYGTAPFDAGDLVGVIDADKDGDNNLADSERYIPVDIRLDHYALKRLVNKSSQNKTSGDVSIKDADGNTVLTLDFTDGSGSIDRDPAVAS